MAPDDNMLRSEKKKPKLTPRTPAQNVTRTYGPTIESPEGQTPFLQSNPQMTRTVSGTQDPLAVKEQLRVLQKQRMRAINAALTTNDPAARAAAISQRDSLESDIRPLGQAMPRTFLTPEGVERSALDMRQKLTAARASAPQPVAPNMSGTDAAYAAGARGAPQGVLRPMADPRDEIRRQQIIRLKGMEPTLGGTMDNPELTTPAQQELMRRKASVEPQAPQRPVEEVFPGVGASDRAAIDQRFREQQNRNEYWQPKATEVSNRLSSEQDAARRIRANQVKMAEESSRADTAEQTRRAEGTDTSGIADQIARIQAETALANAKRGAGRATPLDTAGSGESAVGKFGEAVSGQVGPMNYISRLLAPLQNLTLGGLLYGTGTAADDQKIRIAFTDIQNAVPSMDINQRQAASQELRKRRDSIVGKVGAEQYLNQIEELLSKIEPGAQ
jgi:hypothetical protein